MLTDVQLHEVFVDEPFSVAEALRLGTTRETLRHRRFAAPSYGVRAFEHPGSLLGQRALGYAPRLRHGERYSHVTALALWGCPIRAPRGTPIDVEVPAPLGQARGRGVRGHRRISDDAQVARRTSGSSRRLPLTPPLRAVQQSATLLPFSELMVALDFFLCPRAQGTGPRAPFVTRQELADYVSTATGRGVRRLRCAAELARAGAESRMETLMRLAGIRAGLPPDMTLQLNIFSPDGTWIGRFDLVDPETRAIYEYDGEQHRLERRQYLRDLDRLERVRAAGWRVLRLHAEDLLGDTRAARYRLLAHSGRSPVPVRAELARLLDERASGPTEPVFPIA